ncbi:unnamed protein product [Camellia sinensis]
MLSLPFVVLCQYSSFNKIQLPPNVTSAVAVTFDFLGRGPFVAVSDGRILQWLGPLFGFMDFVYTAPNSVAPTKYRGSLGTLCQIGTCLGSIASLILGSPSENDPHW